MMAAHFFVIRASSLRLRHSFVIESFELRHCLLRHLFQRAEIIRIFLYDIFPDKDQFGDPLQTVPTPSGQPRN